MDLIRRAVWAYYRANVRAWVALRRLLPVVDPWLAAGVAQLAATAVLVDTGHPDAALIVAATCVWVLVLQRLTDR